VPHLWRQGGRPAAPGDTEMLEAYTTLGFLAAQTERVRLGTMVTGVTFRPPALLVKAVTTLDVLSGGRAWLGLGAGYHGEEAAAMGLPLPPVAERFERLEGTLRVPAPKWGGGAPAGARGGGPPPAAGGGGGGGAGGALADRGQEGGGRRVPVRRPPLPARTPG